jgi:hypothetical protein
MICKEREKKVFFECASIVDTKNLISLRNKNLSRLPCTFQHIVKKELRTQGAFILSIGSDYLNTTDKYRIQLMCLVSYCIIRHTLLLFLRFYLVFFFNSSLSQWPRDVTHGPAAAGFLGLRVRIPTGYECLYLVSVVCCQVEVSASGWSLVHRSPTACGVPEYNREASIMRKPWPTRGLSRLGGRGMLWERYSYKKLVTPYRFLIKYVGYSLKSFPPLPCL